MYCVIQEIENKKFDEYGEFKNLEVDTTTWTIDGETRTKYSYKWTGGRFERPIRKAYRISIHKSYREKGKVKKKQWSICTMGYYELLEFSPWDCIIQSKLNERLQEMNITEDELWDMVYKKLDPIIKKVESEFHKTEEYKSKQKHEEITTLYAARKAKFEDKYGHDTYDYCYDIFGTLRNEEMLNNIKRQYEARKEYESSYYESYKSNYSNYDFGSYQEINQSTYTKEEKEYLKVIYKAAAMKLHPDIKKDNGEGMKFLNQLKDKWGI
ncbi:hypothetical protein DP125_06035 [Clostridium tetani]|uniref:hypothetical protein n=1 Tax=Clostridium tetani TaxID=1513 RepID=UPI001009E5EA|nr:hypothetical protein [Clostridium tetani]RXI60148.1 hypothetical protein DP132_11690 [Clostridium tetani]RXI61031.1 hypothetical protein DP125_06035 [Clostridium tetani]RXI64967.1 hypothetical protein DP123_06450 [Clostridium tetani]RXI71024.1 hypothetical protein DP121_05785 [Clostridium tetani]RXM72225.1 hypothetical protein DP143_10555 [Clostridium tetani]